MKLAVLLEKEECELVESTYIKDRRMLTLLCKKHSVQFEQCSSNFYRGFKSCPHCKKEKQKVRVKDIKLTHLDFLRKCGDKTKFFEYLSEYNGAENSIIIKCLRHDYIYEQLPWVHIKGEGCPKCSNELRGLNRRKTHLNFVERANTIHNNSYEYPFEYEKRNKKLKMKCKIHGIFQQTPGNHLNGKGCSDCNYANKISKPELEIQNILEKMGYEIQTSNRKIIHPYEIDIYIPKLRKAIEFNGLYWHYSKKLFRPGYHAQKSNLCREKGIKLLHIREDLWIKDKEKMEKVIKRFLQN